MRLIQVLTLISFSISLSSYVHAEEVGQNKIAKEGKIILEPEIGSTSFHVSGVSSSYRSASLIGASMRMDTENERLSWTAGAQYIQTGFKERVDFGFFSVNVTEVSTDYFALPVKAEYLISHPNNGGVKYFLSGGMTPAYLLSAKLKNLLDSGEKERGVRNDMNGFDILLGFGLGARYESEIGVFDLGFSYERGQRDVIKDTASKSEGFIAKAGYHITL